MVCCMVLMLSTMYSGPVFYNEEIPKSSILNAFYSSMYHLTWVHLYPWIIIAVSCGYGAYINWILSWNPMMILSKLTYSTFLVHGIVQMFFAGSLRSPQHMGYMWIIFNIGGQIFFSFFFGWILSMLVEAPVLGIEKIIFSKTQAKYTESTENLEQKVENGRANEKGSVNGINGSLNLSTHI
ncbi:unnamed protein product [Brassicogethes aeneus]|uniref:Uncharacterized protein n=1 Tax=Brassicogethes aeneus TaxID=1431903 RepID=A0A9P0BD44_BRAAE|nr:unnamed protein product [Brassicogethes aeneus]